MLISSRRGHQWPAHLHFRRQTPDLPRTVSLRVDPRLRRQKLHCTPAATERTAQGIGPRRQERNHH